MRYKHVLVTRHGGPEVLQVVEDEVPDPRPGEVRVKVLAIGVAFTDVLIREGLYPGIPKPPFSPGYEIVGVVDQSTVPDVNPGQRVAALTITGGYSEYICLPATELVPVPDAVATDEAACSILQYVTAYQLLHRMAHVKPGDKILVHGAGGGVGTAVLELGKLAELQMYGTASQGKHALVQQLGGIPIDYRQEDFVQRIREETGDGVNVVLDAIGGTHLFRSYQVLRQDGCLVSYGFSSVLQSQRGRLLKLGLSFLWLTLLKVLPGNRQATFYSITDLKRQHPDWFHADLNAVFSLLAEHKIKPVISDRLSITEAEKAHELLDRSAVHGQLVLVC
jgi:NADPH:quinone reductase-like Zn-dependent oxidoreductase